MPVDNLAYLHGKPASEGLLRCEPQDFKVFELLPFSPSGEGEHVYLYIRKTLANTIAVARQLAKYFGVKEHAVTYAGLKDKFAVTEQWFGVHLPGKQQFTAEDILLEGIEVLACQRHNKKLKIGNLIGNRFELVLRDVTNLEDIEQRWQKVQQSGVPNYFGEQRFGFSGRNIDMANKMFAGQKVKDKKKRGIYLSAARSQIFNQVVSHRVSNDQFDQIEIGDVCMLAGTQSIFDVENVDDVLVNRLAEYDIDLTAPMWGAGELRTQAAIQEFEQATASQFLALCEGLEAFGLKQERRRIRLCMTHGKISFQDNTVKLSFMLPAGAYATTILRELINYQDASDNKKEGEHANSAQ